MENTISLREQSCEKAKVQERFGRDRKNKDASCMIYHRYTARSGHKRHLASSFLLSSLILSPPAPSSPAYSFLSTSLNHSFFFHQPLLLQLLLPTFEVTSRPFRPSVTSDRAGGSKSGRHFCQCEEERESCPGRLKVRVCLFRNGGFLSLSLSYRTLVKDKTDDECRAAHR